MDTDIVMASYTYRNMTMKGFSYFFVTMKFRTIRNGKGSGRKAGREKEGIHVE
jgi:hypothetical protein